MRYPHSTPDLVSVVPSGPEPAGALPSAVDVAGLGARELAASAALMRAAAASCAGCTDTLRRVSRTLRGLNKSLRRRPWRRASRDVVQGSDGELRDAERDLQVLGQELGLHEHDLRVAHEGLDALTASVAALDTDDADGDLEVRYAARQRLADLTAHGVVLAQCRATVALNARATRDALAGVRAAYATSVPAALAAATVEDALRLLEEARS